MTEALVFCIACNFAHVDSYPHCKRRQVDIVAKPGSPPSLFDTPPKKPVEVPLTDRTPTAGLDAETMAQLDADEEEIYTGYDGTPPHENVSTSIEAAQSVKPIVGRLQLKVLEVIRQRGDHGATDDEIEMLTGLKHQTASARRRELYLAGKIVSTGTRLTRSDRKAKVWVIRKETP